MRRDNTDSHLYTSTQSLKQTVPTNLLERNSLTYRSAKTFYSKIFLEPANI